MSKSKNGGKIILVLVVVIVVIIASFLLLPSTQKENVSSKSDEFTKVARIIKIRCATCHSANPSDKMFQTAPSGLIIDTKEEIIYAKDHIYDRTILSDSMPFGNKTHMTQEERDILGKWIASLDSKKQ
jgi:uncharacterized membrane protein